MGSRGGAHCSRAQRFALYWLFVARRAVDLLLVVQPLPRDFRARPAPMDIPFRNVSQTRPSPQAVYRDPSRLS